MPLRNAMNVYFSYKKRIGRINRIVKLGYASTSGNIADEDVHIIFINKRNLANFILILDWIGQTSEDYSLLVQVNIPLRHNV